MTSSASVAAYWDTAAATFDTAPDHGLASFVVRAAWAQRLREWIPDDSAEVLDVGCGTGSLAYLLAAQGHQVTGVDISPNMVEHARRKLAGCSATVVLGDAADPPVAGRRFDVVLCRHLMWTLPDPGAALRRWVGMLRPGGQLVLVEGRWGAADMSTDMPWWGGVSADVLWAAVSPLVARVHVEHLTDALLWGREIADERYALLAHV
ncbi:MAG TPA: class I SAM-dependent methyltransferase [Pseudonocardiaceae bacterium]|nr:class I SAM-dependent methyltransferase [Pseudonocardiaceae bacterium]